MSLYDIKSLFCRYWDTRQNKFVEVLEIDDITIERGEITVILGPSGCGKSTFMEAISLMSDTVDRKKSKKVLFYDYNQDGSLKTVLDLSLIEKDPRVLQDLRQEKFCFIFQDTNIMENFNPVENVALPRMANEETESCAMKDAENVLRNRLGLTIDLENKGHNYSGGQQQRFSFARAFLAKGDILFGDEPTGNLDKYNSEKLFNVIAHYVKSPEAGAEGYGKKSGAIIVTHSIDLALEFADKIIVIAKPDKSDINNTGQAGKGYTNPFFVYRNSGNTRWREDNPVVLNNYAINPETDAELLPPIDDDGSTRFTYLHEDNDPLDRLKKDRLKREIIFYLNNSYTYAQKILVNVAEKLNVKLNLTEAGQEKERFYELFNRIKSESITLVDFMAVNITTIEDFDRQYLAALISKFRQDDEILDLLSGPPLKDDHPERGMEKPNEGLFEDLLHASVGRIYNGVKSVYNRKSESARFSDKFKDLFFGNEIGELYGKKKSNFGKIILLYFILFLSVGIGFQSLKYFNHQLRNPFVRFLNVPIDGEAKLVPYFVDSLKSRYLKKEFRQRFNLDTLRSLSEDVPAKFISEFVNLPDFKGMVDDYNSQLVVEAICNKDNGYVGKPFASIEDRSVIVTLDMLKDLYLIPDSVTLDTLKAEQLPGFMMFWPSVVNHPFPLVLQGVVDRLPSRASFLLTTKFNDHLFIKPETIICNSTDEQVSFYVDTLVDMTALKKVLTETAQHLGITADEYNFSIDPTSGVHSALLVSFAYAADHQHASIVLKEAVKRNFGLKDHQLVDAYYRKYDFSGSKYALKSDKNSLIVVFHDLDRIGSFNKDLKKYSSKIITDFSRQGSTKKRKGIELELREVNLRFILNIIRVIVITFLLVIVSLAVIALTSFIKVLFEKYFQKIEKNIGTLMAFGINIRVVYAIMLTVFFVVTTAISMLAALAGGYLLEGIMWLFYSGTNLKIQLFSFNIYTAVLTLLFIMAANIYAFRKAAVIFTKWPGDILNRRWN